MHILMVANGMDIGGAETHILELSTALRERGHLVTVAAPYGIYTDVLKKRGIGVRTLPRFDGSLLSFFKQTKTLLSVARLEKPHVMHGHARPSCLSAVIVGYALHIPVVSTAHLPFERHGFFQMWTRWGKHVLAVSPDIARHLVEKEGIAKRDITVTRNGIDINSFFPQEEVNQRIVHISRLDEGRAMAASTLLQIAPRLAREKNICEIVIVGDGDQYQSLKKTAREINKSLGYEFVRMTGGMRDVAAMLKGHPIFVGVSRAALEAMACECPIVLAGDEGYGGILSEEAICRESETNFCCRNGRNLTGQQLYRDIHALTSLSDEEKMALGRQLRRNIKLFYDRKRMADDAEYAYASTQAKSRPGIILCGYYGYGNMGDEAALPLILKKCDRYSDRLIVMSKNPSVDRKKYGVRCISRYAPLAFLRNFHRGDVLILGGGNLLQNQTSRRSLAYYLTVCALARLKGGKIAVIRGGLGTIIGERSQKAVAKLLSDCQCLSFRTPDDLHYARSLSPRCQAAFSCDATLLTPELCEDKALLSSKQAYCTVVFRSASKEVMKESIRMIKRFCRFHHCRIIFLIFHKEKDMAVTKKVAALFPNSRIIYTENPIEARRVIKNGICTLTLRLHAGYFSLIENTPCIFLNQDERTAHHLQFIRSCIQSAGLPSKALPSISDCVLTPLTVGEHSRLLATMVVGGQKI